MPTQPQIPSEVPDASGSASAVPDASTQTLDLSSDLVVNAARLMRLVRRKLELPASVRVLTILDAVGPLGITDLARADGCSQPTMSAQIAHLVESGLVSKEPNPADARASLVGLTDSGRADLADVRDRISRLIAERLECHERSQADLETAVSVLRDLVEGDPDAL